MYMGQKAPSFTFELCGGGCITRYRIYWEDSTVYNRKLCERKAQSSIIRLLGAALYRIVF